MERSQDSQNKEPVSTRTHGIIVVHGKATVLERGVQVAKVANAIAETFRESCLSTFPKGRQRAPEPPKIGIETRTDLNPAEVTLAITAPDIPSWQEETSYLEGDYVSNESTGMLVFRRCFKCVKGGKAGTEPPDWPKDTTDLRLDGGVLWQAFLGLKQDVSKLEAWGPQEEYIKGAFVRTDDTRTVSEQELRKDGLDLRFRCIKPGLSGETPLSWEGVAKGEEGQPPGIWSPRPWRQKTTWVFKEAYWNDAFPAPPAEVVMLWGDPVLGTALKYLFWYPAKRAWRLVADPSNGNYRHKNRQKKETRQERQEQERAIAQSVEETRGAGNAERDFSRVKDPSKRNYRHKEQTRQARHERKRAAAQSNEETKGAGNKGTLFISAVFWYGAWILSSALHLVATICYLAIKHTPFAGWLLKKLNIDPLINGIEGELSLSFGDVQRYIEHGVWADSARNRLENVLIDMLGSTTDKTEFAASDDIATFDDITIISESAGTLLAYDTLRKDGEVAKSIGDKGHPPKRITLITLASALNLGMKLAKKSDLYAQSEFNVPLDERITGYDDKILKALETLNAPDVKRDVKEDDRSISGAMDSLRRFISGDSDALRGGGISEKNSEEEVADLIKKAEEKIRSSFLWVDIHARLDFIPCGDVDPDLLNQAQIYKDVQFKGREVVNIDDFLGDHTYYWRNRELVTPRVIAAINGNEYPWDEVSPETKRDSHYKRLKKSSDLSLATKASSVVLAGILLIALSIHYDRNIFAVFWGALKVHPSVVWLGHWGLVVASLVIISVILWGIPSFFRGKWFRTLE